MRARLIPLASALVLAGCGGSAPIAEVPNGDADRGAALIEDYGCGACHDIPGIRGADGRVGPPLDDFAERRFVAGELPNSPENAERWIEDPQAVDRGTAMPDLGVGEDEARDIVSYLYAH